MQDYYEILQVHPKADQEAIRSAYERLRERYAPERLEGAADELRELARTRRDGIERAYIVLSDAQRRTSYDAELRTVEDQRREAVATPAAEPQVIATALIDYRPLPPARRQERPKGFNAQPYGATTVRAAGRQSNRNRANWIVPVSVVAAFTFIITLVSLVNAIGFGPTQTAGPAAGDNSGGPNILGASTSEAATPSAEEIVNRFEGQIVEARQVTQTVPDNPNAWVQLGNTLYDSVQIAREMMPESPLYIERLPRWLEAADAYRKALELQPQNATVQADLAGSLCYYGAGANDTASTTEGLTVARQALADSPQNEWVLLNLGVCNVYNDPPQTSEALTQWRTLVALPSADPNAVAQAQQLIAQYSQ